MAAPAGRYPAGELQRVLNGVAGRTSPIKKRVTCGRLQPRSAIPFSPLNPTTAMKKTLILALLAATTLCSCNTLSSMAPRAPVAEAVTPFTALKYQCIDRISARIASRSVGGAP